jgi:hypothetical protein
MSPQILNTEAKSQMDSATAQMLRQMADLIESGVADLVDFNRVVDYPAVRFATPDELVHVDYTVKVSVLQPRSQLDTKEGA